MISIAVSNLDNYVEGLVISAPCFEQFRLNLGNYSCWSTINLSQKKKMFLWIKCFDEVKQSTQSNAKHKIFNVVDMLSKALY